MSKAQLKLTNGFTFSQLFDLEGLRKLDDEFLARLRARDADAHAKLLRYRAGETFAPVERSELLLACAPVLEEQIIDLFGLHDAVTKLRQQTLVHDPIFDFKKQFVLKRARRRLLKKDEYEPFAELDAWLEAALAAVDAPLRPGSGQALRPGSGQALRPGSGQALRPGSGQALRPGSGQADRELAVARYTLRLLADEAANAEAVEKLTRWCVRAMTSPEGQAATAHWVSLRLPHGVDPAKLVPIELVPDDPYGRFQGPSNQLRRRDGFKLTDPRMSPRQAMNEIHYCIYCHDHDGDFCSKGFPEKKGEPERGLKVNVHGVTLTGCPLDEKISEMHLLKKNGETLAALAMIMVDNPMCAATGHRICNDCMKGCIYQKQDPVNIPQTETSVLTDVLALPWGVEIYDLLIRWNPLRSRQWLPKPYNGLKALVVGMGPAGFTLAHHLLMEGFAVVGVEGLKIEPLPEEFLRVPIRDYGTLREELDERLMAGFGGVAEYGITVRWDKNFLKLIYLSLARRPHFQVFGGVRFGGTVTVEDAWKLGFDHLAICVGAGLPQALPVPGSLAPGMRQANDFLMALQLTGAAKRSSLANLQIRLPAVVIGGGLTGIDTATEVQAYYIAQIEKTLDRYEQLINAFGEATVRSRLDEESRRVLDEYLAHGRAVRAERTRAAARGETPDFLPLLRRWGGVTVAYRRAITESPAYTRNHEEIIKAFEEGIFYADGLDPKEARLDKSGYVEAMAFRKQSRGDDGKWHATGEEVVLPARSILVATGARPNVAYEFEHRGHFAKEWGHYQTYERRDDKNEPVQVASHLKQPDFGPFTSYFHNDRRVSFLGDTHPVFHGSVVGAIASAMRTYPKILETFGDRVLGRADEKEYDDFRERIDALFSAVVQKVRRLAPDVVEIKIRAPMAAEKFRPGQFFRLQNYESLAPKIGGTRLQTEALALYGAHVDRDFGEVTLLVIEQGASAKLCATLKPGMPVALMGPTGVRTKIPDGGETVMIVADRLGLAPALAIGPAMRAKGNRVLLFAQFKSADDVFLDAEIEKAADAVVWCTAIGTAIQPKRPSDRTASGSVVDAIRAYAQAAPTIALTDVDRLLILGSQRLVRQMHDAKRNELAPYFCKTGHTIASVNAPMQCMLKGVCSQCLQWQIDPATGKRTKAIFGCSWQDQPLEMLDLDNLDERLSQNRLQEILADLWLDYLTAKQPLERA